VECGHSNHADHNAADNKYRQQGCSHSAYVYASVCSWWVQWKAACGYWRNSY
jgi:hypothetical protein